MEAGRYRWWDNFLEEVFNYRGASLHFSPGRWKNVEKQCVVSDLISQTVRSCEYRLRWARPGWSFPLQRAHVPSNGVPATPFGHEHALKRKILRQVALLRKVPAPWREMRVKRESRARISVARLCKSLSRLSWSGITEAGAFPPPLMHVAAAYWINTWGPRYL